MSTLSGKEATDAKHVLVVELKDWKILGTIVGIITGVGTLMWQGIDRFHQAEVKRLKGEAQAEAARLQDKVEMYQYYVQVFGTRDHEPLKESVPTAKRKRRTGPGDGG